MNRLGHKIKQLRIKQGMKQGELAKDIVTPSMISQIEAGKAHPSHKLLEQIAERLGTSVNYFLSDIQFKQEQSSTYRLAKSYMDHEDYQRASILLEELANQDEFYMNHSVFLDLAECHTKLNKQGQALILYQTLYEKGLQQANHELSVIALNKQGVLFFNRKQYSIAKWYWEQAYSLAKRNHGISNGLFAQVHLNLGTVYGKLAQRTASETHFSGAYELLRGTNLIGQIAEACMGLGVAYRFNQKYKLATEYTQDAIAIYRSLNIHHLELHARLNLAIIKRENHQLQEAIEILNHCIEEYVKLDRHDDVVNAKVELARTYIYNLNQNDNIRQTQLEMTVSICDDALESATDDSIQQADIFEILGDISALEKRYSDAVQYYKNSIRIFFHHSLVTPILRVCTSLANLNKDFGEYKDATKTYLEMEQMIDNILKKQLPVEIE